MIIYCKNNFKAVVYELNHGEGHKTMMLAMGHGRGDVVHMTLDEFIAFAPHPEEMPMAKGNYRSTDDIEREVFG